MSWQATIARGILVCFLQLCLHQLQRIIPVLDIVEVEDEIPSRRKNLLQLLRI